MSEIGQMFPALMQNDDKPRLEIAGLLAMARRDPVGFAAYALVSLLVKTPLFADKTRWARGR